MNRKTIVPIICTILAAVIVTALGPQSAAHGAAGLVPLAGEQGHLPTGCFHINIPIVMREFEGVPVAGLTPGKYSRPMADYNGDGCADLAIGITGKEVNGIDNAGSVMVVFGTLGDWTAGPYTQVLTQPDETGQDRFGNALTHGDFNSDGYSDLAVAAYNRTVLGAVGAGHVRIFYGSVAGLDETQYTDFTQVGLVDFPEFGDYFGRDLAAGDFNGDGYDDLVVGATGEDYQTIVESGVIHIIFGSENGLSTAGNIRYAQNDLNTGDVGVNDQFGRHLASGDFNRDGYDDIAVGSPTESILLMINAGAVDVLFGSPAGPTTANLFIDQDLMPNSSIDDWDSFGSDVLAADFDGDGYADLAIGSYGEPVNGFDNAGAAFVLYGAGSGLSFAGIQKWDQGNLPGVEEEFDGFGVSLSAGDFNGDGYDELAVGVPGENVANLPGEESAGAVQVLFGSNTGLTGTGSQIWHQDVDGIVGTAAKDDRFGQTLTSGDYNRDGYMDLAVGVPFDDFSPPAVTSSGEVNVIYGSAAGLAVAGNLRFYQALFIIPGESETLDQFGGSIR